MKKIFVFDDEEDVRYLITHLINRAKEYSVVGEAADGSDGIELCLNVSPDIVVTDIRMPGYNGLELLAKLKKKLPGVEVILISGYEKFEYAQEAIALGAVSYLLKPIEENELLAALDRASQRIDSRARSKKNIENMKQTIEKLQSTLIDEYPQTQNTASQYSADIQKVLDYIEKNYMNDISLSDGAKMVFMNPSYFSDKFKKATGKSFTNYVSDFRQEIALQLLKRPNLKIREIAGLVGYSDVNYFARVFKKYTGLSPIEYRLKSNLHVSESSLEDD